MDEQDSQDAGLKHLSITEAVIARSMAMSEGATSSSFDDKDQPVLFLLSCTSCSSM